MTVFFHSLGVKSARLAAGVGKIGLHCQQRTDMRLMNHGKQQKETDKKAAQVEQKEAVKVLHDSSLHGLLPRIANAQAERIGEQGN